MSILENIIVIPNQTECYIKVIFVIIRFIPVNNRTGTVICHTDRPIRIFFNILSFKIWNIFNILICKCIHTAFFYRTIIRQWRQIIRIKIRKEHTGCIQHLNTRLTNTLIRNKKAISDVEIRFSRCSLTESDRLQILQDKK